MDASKSMDAFAAIREVKAGRLAPVYLAFGKEGFLRDRLFAAIRRQAVPAELDELNVTVFDGTEGPLERALELARTMPFLAPYRVVAVRDWPPLAPLPQGKGAAAGRAGEQAGEDEAESPRDTGEAALLQYLAHPSPTAILVFLAGDGVDRRRKVYKALAQHHVVECQPLRDQEMVTWLRDRSEELGKTLEMLAARELARRLPTNLALMDSELAKLVACAGDQPTIRLADVEAVVPGIPENNIFELLGAISRRERGRALGLLERMFRGGEPPPRLLFMIARELRLLLTVKVLTEQGQGPKGIEQRTHLHPAVVRNLIGEARGFDRDDLVRALEQVLEADVAVKTSRMDPQLVLQLLLLDLSRA
ncbi:MAG: DNA polymerase III subunit delta [Symbiobacteriia bacterium]